jgi:hypothetical protein
MLGQLQSTICNLQLSYWGGAFRKPPKRAEK